MPDIQNRQYILETRPKGVANDKNVVLKQTQYLRQKMVRYYLEQFIYHLIPICEDE